MTDHPRKAAAIELKLELVPIPVRDIDRAKAFYADQLGFNVDHDVQPTSAVRVVQLTPPGSACSIAIGSGLTGMEPGSLDNLQVVVGDADAALAHLRGHGVECEGVDEQPWGRFVYFADPDGNRWAIQQLPEWAEYADAHRS